MLRFVARVLIARQHDLSQTSIARYIIAGGRFRAKVDYGSLSPEATRSVLPAPKPPSAERVLGDSKAKHSTGASARHRGAAGVASGWGQTAAKAEAVTEAEQTINRAPVKIVPPRPRIP